MSRPRILVAEANHAIAAELRKHLYAAGMDVDTVSTAEAALSRMRVTLPQVLLCGVAGLDAAQLSQGAKRISLLLQVVLVFPPGDADCDAQVKACMADGYLVGPLKRSVVVPAVRWLLRVHDLSVQVARLSEEVDLRLGAPSGWAGDAPQADLEFFKRLLLMEVKRSRRYRYPLSFLLVGIDGGGQLVGSVSADERERLAAKLMASIVKNLRGMDLCVRYGKDHFLVFLPHTDRAGARKVSRRIREQSKETAGSQLTVSVGLASYAGGGEPVTFGGLVKEATACLKKAQLLGGDRVEDSAEAPKAAVPTREFAIDVEVAEPPPRKR